jgi:hypothetical protein
MLRDEVEQYTKLTGEDGWHVPIIRVGAYLDGYNKGLEALDKIRAEIEQAEIGDYIRDAECFRAGLNRALNIIDKYKVESEE